MEYQYLHGYFKTVSDTGLLEEEELNSVDFAVRTYAFDEAARIYLEARGCSRYHREYLTDHRKKFHSMLKGYRKLTGDKLTLHKDILANYIRRASK